MRPDPAQRRSSSDDPRRHRLERVRRDRELLQARRAEAVRQAEARPPDWVLPAGQSYTALGPAPGQTAGPDRVLGTWVPNRRSPDATVHTFVPDELPGESEEQRVQRLRQALMTPAMRRAERDNALLAAWAADADKRPVASLYCNARSARGQRCRRRLGNLYRVRHGYVLADARHYTFPEARALHLSTALLARQRGVEWVAQLKQAAAEVKAWDHVLTLDPRSADDPLSGRALGMPFDPVLIGCRSHGNVLVSTAWLRTVAKEQRKVACDPQAQRVYALDSELSG